MQLERRLRHGGVQKARQVKLEDRNLGRTRQPYASTLPQLPVESGELSRRVESASATTVDVSPPVSAAGVMVTAAAGSRRVAVATVTVAAGQPLRVVGMAVT